MVHGRTPSLSGTECWQAQSHKGSMAKNCKNCIMPFLWQSSILPCFIAKMALCHKKWQHAIFAIFCHVALVALCLPTLCPGERWGPAMDHLPFSICGNVTIFAMLLFWYVCHVCGDSRVRFEVRSSGSVRFEGRGAIRGEGCFQKT